MWTKILTVFVSIIMSLALVACTTTLKNSHKQQQSRLVTYPTQVSSSRCEAELHRANRDIYKGHHAKNIAAVINWSKVNKHFAAATFGQQTGNYNRCVKQAKFVSNYIERCLNYLKWQQSMRS